MDNDKDPRAEAFGELTQWVQKHNSLNPMDLVAMLEVTSASIKIPIVQMLSAPMAKSVDATDLKSVGEIHAGSSPARGTKQ